MQVLEKNINNILGKEGEIWLKRIPVIAEKLQKYWKLSDLSPVENMTYNYVMKGIQNNKTPVVLKIAPFESFIQSEVEALKAFNGCGSVLLLNYNCQCHASLLQQALPGTTLKSLYSKEKELSMNAYIQTMRAIHARSIPSKAQFPHIRDWLKSIENVKEGQIPQHYLDTALQLKERLLNSSKKEILLHGDLHHDNVLKHHRTWLSIDPKGVIGEAEFEIAAFDFISSCELFSSKNVVSLFYQRLSKIARLSKLSQERIADWVYVRLILGAAWMLEDSGDPEIFLKFVKNLFR